MVNCAGCKAGAHLGGAEITTQMAKNGDLGGKLCWLQGFNPILTVLVAVGIMTFLILALVYGFDKKLLTSFLGAMSGILFAMILSIICSRAFHVHKAVMHNSEALLYSVNSSPAKDPAKGFIELHAGVEGKDLKKYL